MSANSDDLISLWLARHSSSNVQDSPTESDDQKDPGKASPLLTPGIPHQNSAKTSPTSEARNKDEHSDKIARPTPALSGRLAEHLASQKTRSIPTTASLSSDNDTPWTTDDLQTKSVLAMSLVLASHLTRFAGTSLSEKHLTRARDELMRCFNAPDAVKIEVEAYELLNWFAGAMNENWHAKTTEVTDIPQGETSEAAILFIISEAIRCGHDLNMRYYTGSRGQFTERRITPIEVTAEKYLIAYCHLREEERVFRLTRIVQLTPVASDGQELQSTLCYPNVNDTMLPPLPATPSVEMKPVKSRKRKSDTQKLEKRGNTDKSKPHAKAKAGSASRSKNSRSTESEPQKPSSTPSLFDFEPSKKKKTAPKKNSQERSLFD